MSVSLVMQIVHNALVLYILSARHVWLLLICFKINLATQFVLQVITLIQLELFLSVHHVIKFVNHVLILSIRLAIHVIVDIIYMELVVLSHAQLGCSKIIQFFNVKIASVYPNPKDKSKYQLRYSALIDNRSYDNISNVLTV